MILAIWVSNPFFEMNLSVNPFSSFRDACSGGMNGYISLCAGDPCPPVFRSPIQGMEDIMNNQVICAIYKLPDAHQHIPRPAPGVVFPKKSVTEGDLKPAPVLWHEDSGRKPFNNGRQDNSNGAISGRQLGDAAHRLVYNSLQIRAQNGHGAHPYPPHHPPHVAGYDPRHQPYPNQAFPIGDRSALRPDSGYPPRDFRSHAGPTTYGHPYPGPSHSSLYNRHYQPRDDWNNRSAYDEWNYSRQGYYPSGPPQHGGAVYPHQYPHGRGVQAPVRPGAYLPPHPKEYNNPAAHRSYGNRDHHSYAGGAWVPRGNSSGDRGYSNPPRLSGNQFSALGREASRQPASDHRRQGQSG